MKKIILPIIGVIIFVVLSFIYRKQKQQIIDKLTGYLVIGDIDSFDKLYNAKKTKTFVNRFNLDLIVLNKYIIENDKGSINKKFKEFDKYRLNNKQKEAVYKKAFYYYVGIEDKDNSKEYFDRIQKLNITDIDNIERIFDVYINGGNKYLENTLEEINFLPVSKRSALESMISRMYYNVEDYTNAEKYRKLAEKHFKEQNDEK